MLVVVSAQPLLHRYLMIRHFWIGILGFPNNAEIFQLLSNLLIPLWLQEIPVVYLKRLICSFPTTQAITLYITAKFL